MIEILKTTEEAAAAVPVSPQFDSLFDMILHGGPVMVPLGVCSVIAFAYALERSMRLNRIRLGTAGLAGRVAEAVRLGGTEGGLEICRERPTPLTRVLAEGLRSAARPLLEREKAVEDAGLREVKRLSANLRPLVVVGMIAPLMGLFGTVWGMIDAFSNIATQGGPGKPDILAAGISQALITTAAGLAIAIPTQAVYFWLKSRIDRFVRVAEDGYMAVNESLETVRANS